MEQAAQGWSHHALTTRGSQLLAVAVLLGSLVFPVSGLGMDLCVVHAATKGLPCPGCGMSRALAAMTQGDLSAALGLHPFVVLVWPLLLALAALALMPRTVAVKVGARLDRVGPSLTRGYRLVAFAFLAFGLARFALFLALGERFP